MRIVADHAKCTGLGMCEAEAPEFFEVQDDGSLKVLKVNPSAEELAAVQAAIDSCPTEALTLVED
ncbi:ferredoxin [Sporichthya polymorpha]|uniref:ferredoxin n=1 Tax=Sporichthya polymorpha TaxID=35751 RepID=UPI00037A05FE|nr:ferredoxin [Sporichthya polymorpha]